MKQFYSNGKLLISGEYVVLDGALAFAMPTKFGQNLQVEDNTGNTLEWVSYNNENQQWFAATFNLDFCNEATKEKAITTTTHQDKALTLLTILLEAKRANPTFLNTGATVTTQLSFPNNWGLGTSSTLINSIAAWAGINAFTLLWNSFKGSGYDIACAQNNTPITYQITNNAPVVTPQPFAPAFAEHIYFVHLNQKMDSKEGIKHYRAMGAEKEELLPLISNITNKLLQATELTEFETLLNAHEDLIAKYLKLTKVKDLYFEDYWGSVKSLGAWGGDFVLVTGNKETPAYFKSKGYHTILPYKDMLL